MEQQVQFPEMYQRDIRRAASILKEAGCTHVFLFGSLTSPGLQGESDIALAVRGCSKGKLFHLLGRLLLELEHPVDLVDLDRQRAFACYLEEEGDLLQVC
jgi:predicted nucleotidyltransferase